MASDCCSNLVENPLIASYAVNERAVARARRLIRGRQYVLDSDWGEVQPKAEDENALPTPFRD